MRTRDGFVFISVAAVRAVFHSWLGENYYGQAEQTIGSNNSEAAITGGDISFRLFISSAFGAFPCASASSR
jgi:hypothetical protein